MKNTVIIGLLSVLALAVVGTVGSTATPASASFEWKDDMKDDKEKLKCKVLDGEKDDYFKLKCKTFEDDWD
jgi:hypothetical protein